MSKLFVTIRDIVGDSLNFVMDDYIVTVDPHGDNTQHQCRGFTDDDHERHRERGLTIETGDRVVVLLQAQTEALTNINSGDYIEGPTNNANRNEKSIVRDVGRDPADATWVLAVNP